MAPLRYDNRPDPYAGTIAELILHGADARARSAENIAAIQAAGAQQQAGVWSGAVQNIGQAVSAIPLQMQALKRAQLNDQIGTLQLQGMQQSANDDALFRKALSLSQNGDLSQAVEFLKAQGGAGIPALQKLSAMAHQQKEQHDIDAGEIGYRLHLVGNSPEGVKRVMGDAVKTGALPPEDAQRFYMLSVEDPSKIADVSRELMARSPKHAPLLEQTGTKKDDETVYNKFTGQPLAGLSATSKPKTTAELAADAANPNSPTQAQSATALDLLKPPKDAARTAEQDDQRYRDIVARKALKQPISADDAAWATGYEQQKTLGVDKSAGAAADRQAAALGAQVAQQKRAQDFAALQAARADLEKNVNTPYNTAKTSANTLRDVVEAAKNGNTVAGSLQALETTMAAIRAQGLNRINTAEIGSSANAGSLFQNIAGWVGKKAEGQPVPASVQKDMLEFASILEKAAYKKYQTGHKAVNALYGTSIPELLTGPEDGSAAVAPTLTPGLAVLAGRK